MTITHGKFTAFVLVSSVVGPVVLEATQIIAVVVAEHGGRSRRGREGRKEQTRERGEEGADEGERGRKEQTRERGEEGADEEEGEEVWRRNRRTECV